MVYTYSKEDCGQPACVTNYVMVQIISACHLALKSIVQHTKKNVVEENVEKTTASNFSVFGLNSVINVIAQAVH